MFLFVWDMQNQNFSALKKNFLTTKAIFKELRCLYISYKC